MALSREDVLAGAMRLLDEVGLDALADALVAGVLEPAPDGEWDEVLAEISRRLVARLTSHRDAARLTTMTVTPGPHGLIAAEAMMRALKRAGLAKDATLWGASVLGYYILGYAMDAQATEAAKTRGMTAVVTALREQLDPKQHRELVAMTRGRGALEQMMSPRELRTRFEFGLALILNGLKTQAAAKARRRAPRRRR